MGVVRGDGGETPEAEEGGEKRAARRRRHRRRLKPSRWPVAGGAVGFWFDGGGVCTATAAERPGGCRGPVGREQELGFDCFFRLVSALMGGGLMGFGPPK